MGFLSQSVRWLDIDDSKPEFKNLYASHRHMVLMALEKAPEQWGHALDKVGAAFFLPLFFVN